MVIFHGYCIFSSILTPKTETMIHFIMIFSIPFESSQLLHLFSNFQFHWIYNWIMSVPKKKHQEKTSSKCEWMGLIYGVWGFPMPFCDPDVAAIIIITIIIIVKLLLLSSRSQWCRTWICCWCQFKIGIMTRKTVHEPSNQVRMKTMAWNKPWKKTVDTHNKRRLMQRARYK